MKKIYLNVKDIKNNTIRILPPEIKWDNELFEEYTQRHSYNYPFETDEDILEKMDIKTIESFLRKKKIQNINSK